MKRFLFDLFLFALIQAGVLAFLLHGAGRRSDEYLAASRDKQHRLATAPGPRVVFVGGSSLAFGVDSEAVGEALARTPVNMGLHAGLGLPFMFRETLAGLRPDDLVVLSPEYEHFTDDVFRDGVKTLFDRLFLVNPAALRYASWQNRWWGLADNANGLHFFRDAARAWAGYGPQTEPPYCRRVFNAAGDVVVGRSWDPVKATGYDKTDNPRRRAKAVRLVEEFVAACRARGAAVVCALPAVPTEGANVALLRQIEHDLRPVVPVALGGEESLLTRELFFDSTYHLNNRGVAIRSRLLADRLGRATAAAPPAGVTAVIR